jgi:hypothetical protein
MNQYDNTTLTLPPTTKQDSNDYTATTRDSNATGLPSKKGEYDAADLPAIKTRHDSNADSNSSTYIAYDKYSPFKGYLSNSNNFVLSAWCIIASFTTYFCVYAFRKAVFAHTYEFAGGWFGSGMSFKEAISLMQTLGLTISKITGIKYVYSFFNSIDSSVRCLEIIGEDCDSLR